MHQSTSRWHASTSRESSRDRKATCLSKYSRFAINMCPVRRLGWTWDIRFLSSNKLWIGQRLDRKLTGMVGRLSVEGFGIYSGFEEISKSGFDRRKAWAWRIL